MSTPTLPPELQAELLKTALTLGISIGEENARLRALNAELAAALEGIAALQGTEIDEWDGVERLIPEMCELARAALANHNKGEPA